MPDIKNDKTNEKFWINILTGAAIAAVITIGAMLLAAVIMTAAGGMRAYASPIAGVTLCIGTIIGARFAAFKNGSRGLICGSLTALVLFAVLTVAGMFVNNGFTVMTLIHFAISLLSGCIGGILGVNRTEKRKVI